MKKNFFDKFRNHTSALNSPSFYLILIFAFISLSIALVQDFNEIIGLLSFFWF